MTAQKNTREWTDGLRALADFLNDHPDLAIWFGNVRIGDGFDRGEAYRALAARGATVTRYDGEQMEASLSFGPVEAHAHARRSDVQQRVVIGMEQLPNGVKIPICEWRDLPVECSHATVEDRDRCPDCTPVPS